jgi:hypothetical protein
MAPSTLAKPRYVIEPLMVVAEPHHAPDSGRTDVSAAEPALPHQQRGTWCGPRVPRRELANIVLDAERAPPGAGVKVVRPRPPAAGAPPGPRRLGWRARGYEDNTTVICIPHRDTNVPPLTRPRSFTDDDLYCGRECRSADLTRTDSQGLWDSVQQRGWTQRQGCAFPTSTFDPAARPLDHGGRLVDNSRGSTEGPPTRRVLRGGRNQGGGRHPSRPGLSPSASTTPRFRNLRPRKVARSGRLEIARHQRILQA